MDPRQIRPARPQARQDQQIQRYSILGAILLCTLISGLLGDSLIGVYRYEVGEAIPRGWRWLLGEPVQTFGTQTFALLFGIVLLGFALGGVWFLARIGLRMLRDLLQQ